MKNNYIEMISKCISFIEDNLTSKITIDDVLERTYYSYPHFQRIFIDIVGDSVTGYIKKRKLSCAAHDLVVTNKAIVDVALDYNYASQQTFNRAFSDMFTISPQKYRERGMLDDVDNPFAYPTPGNFPLASSPVYIVELPPMRIASFYYYNGEITPKNQYSQQDKVVSKAWGGLIKWQLSYEYQKHYGKTNKLPITRKLGRFIIDNALHLPPNTRYFGFANPFPFSDTEFGYEAWAMLGKYSEGEALYLEDSGVEIKDFCGGLYTSTEASYGKESNLNEAWKLLHYWLAENNQYEYGEHQWLEEHITKENRGGFHSFKLFMAIKPVILV